MREEDPEEMFAYGVLQLMNVHPSDRKLRSMAKALFCSHTAREAAAHLTEWLKLRRTKPKEAHMATADVKQYSMDIGAGLTMVADDLDELIKEFKRLDCLDWDDRTIEVEVTLRKHWNDDTRKPKEAKK